MLHIWVVCFEHMAKRCCDMRKVCGYTSEDCKRHTVWHKLNVHQIFSQILHCYSYTMIFILILCISLILYIYMPNLLKLSECKHTMQVFVMLSIWSLFRCFRKFVFAEFLATWVCVEIVMYDSRMVISSIFWSCSLHFFTCT